jgi:hypothetical protein
MKGKKPASPFALSNRFDDFELGWSESIRRGFHFSFCILGFAFFIAIFDAVAVGSGLNEEGLQPCSVSPLISIDSWFSL